MTRFSLLVIADTQYLFDGDRKAPELLRETFLQVAQLTDAGAVAPIEHVIHVGDVTEHGWAAEAAAAALVLAEGAELLGGVAMTIATGNHDVAHHSDDQRGPTPFVAAFGPGCPLLGQGVEHGPGGYSSFRALPGGPAVLALDWRPSEEGWRWADEVLTAHPDAPTVVVSHETALNAELTEHGRAIEALLANHSQAFLVLGGHEWPSTRVTVAGRECHAVNYQELPFGGAGAARIYEFRPDEGLCQVISICPALHHPTVVRSVAARRRLSLSRPEDQFSFALPAALGGRATPWQAEGLSPVPFAASDEFELELPGRFVLEVEATLPADMLREWQVLLCRLGKAPDGSPEPLAALSLSSENFLGWMAYTADGEAWATSHEYPPGGAVTIVIGGGESPGVWIDGDPVGRVNDALGSPLVDGPWRWRVGAGEYGGAPADPFGGSVTSIRAWA